MKQKLPQRERRAFGNFGNYVEAQKEVMAKLQQQNNEPQEKLDLIKETTNKAATACFTPVSKEEEKNVEQKTVRLILHKLTKNNSENKVNKSIKSNF